MKRFGMHSRCICATVAAIGLSWTAWVAAQPAAARRPIALEDFFRLLRVSDPQVSPDGRWVAYVVTRVDLEKNQTNADIWLASTDGKSRRPLTTSPHQDRRPRWSPDGRRLVFESNRSGSFQMWLLDLAGGEAQQITDLASEATEPVWSPDGKRLAFVSKVWPEFSHLPLAEGQKRHRQRLEEQARSPVKARVFTQLFARHWDAYEDGRRWHLFVMTLDDGGPGQPRDLTPGDYDAYPTSSTFASAQNFTFTASGRYLLFTAPPRLHAAWSTNYDLWRVSVEGKTPPENLTAANPAADSGPVLSPDGRFLAYRSQKRPGHEADQWELVVVEVDADGTFLGRGRSWTESLDSSVEEYAWLAHEPGVVLSAEYRGRILLYTARPHGAVQELYSAHSIAQPTVSRTDVCAFLRSSLAAPEDVYVLPLAARSAGPTNASNLSRANEALLAQLDLTSAQSVEVPGADGTPMHTWIVRPPLFDGKRKWPVVYMIHGGPQAAWLDAWHWRWNPQLWAAQGYVVVLPNPRGSTGFGQKYVDEISGDWGGKCFQDLMKGADWLEQQAWVDRRRIAAAGASFGGYMMNWFLGNTDRFCTLVNHCGVFNHESMYGTTDELWFDEWEHGNGKPLWEARELYLKHSPHLRAARFKTPTLIIHNDLDFRVPVSEGFQLFVTLQRRGIPSKFINFPDEGHWVLKPRNSEFWHKEIFAWLKQYCPPGPK